MAIGLVFIGCPIPPPTDGKLVIGNNCDDFTITRIMIQGEGGTDINEKNLSLIKGQSKSWTLPIGDYKFSVEVDYTGIVLS